MSALSYYTAEMVRALPEDRNRYETIHGELIVTPAPGNKHQFFVPRLLVLLYQYLEANGIEQALSSPADISWADDILVQPDIFVADLDAWLRSGKWADIQTLHLVIEIVSPSSARTDRTIKRALYQEHHVPEYWVVDIEQRQIEVWTPDAVEPRIAREQLVWCHPNLTAACTLDLVKLFAIP